MTNGYTAQDFRKDKTEAEERITAILRELEDKYPGYRIETLSAFRQTLTGCHHGKMTAWIKIEILNI